MTSRTRTRTRAPARRPARASRRPVRRRTRTRTRRWTFTDRFMLAGIAGGLVYLLAYYLPGVPTGAAPVAGLAVFAFVLGALVALTAARRTPFLRSPVGWRTRR